MKILSGTAASLTNNDASNDNVLLGTFAAAAEVLPSSAPQYNMNFGMCGPDRQSQTFSNWAMTMPRSIQVPGSIVLLLDTKNIRAMSDAFGNGNVTPRDFAITNMYFAVWNTSGVEKLLELFRDPSERSTTWYQILVNGKKIGTVSNFRSGVRRASQTNAMFSLKAKMSDPNMVKPSTKPIKIVISRVCSNARSCALIPDPQDVFVSKGGHVVYAIWSVGQTLNVNGEIRGNHAWCPVQSAVNVN